MMKKSRTFWLILGCLLVLGFSGRALAAVQNGWDAKKTHYYQDGKVLKGLQEIDGKTYFFNSKGVLQKKKWKKITTGKKTYTYYFGKDGAAYKAKPSNFELTFKTWKIGKKTYGFDSDGHMVTGIWATPTGKAYVFSKKGVYSAKSSKSLRALTKSRKQGKKLMNQVLKACGEPKKTETAESCNYFAEVDHSYTDYRLVYENVTVELTKDNTSGIYCMMGIYPLLLEESRQQTVAQ